MSAPVPTLPLNCKMASHSRYASDIDCRQCGFGEGDVCAEYQAYSDASIAAKREASAQSSAMTNPVPADVSEVVARLTTQRSSLHGDWLAAMSEAASLLTTQAAEIAAAQSAFERIIADYDAEIAVLRAERDEARVLCEAAGVQSQPRHPGRFIIGDDGWSYPSAVHALISRAETAERQLAECREKAIEESAAVARSFVTKRSVALEVEYWVNDTHGGDATVDEFVPYIGDRIAAAIRALLPKRAK